MTSSWIPDTDPTCAPRGLFPRGCEPGSRYEERPLLTTTAVTDRSAVTVSSLKTRFGITGTDSDDILEEAPELAKADADLYLNNAFLGRDASGAWDTNDPLTIPALVERGVIAMVSVELWYNAILDTVTAGAISGSGSLPPGTVTTSVRTGDLAESYGTIGAGSAGAFQESTPVDPWDWVRSRYWSRYRLTPL